MGRGLTHWIDISILVVYFVLALAIGFYASRQKGIRTVNGYFLAGRTMLWFQVGASLFSSNIGSEHFIGLAGSGAVSGIATIVFEWSAAVLLPFMGWVILPVYLSSRVFTVPEYLSKRFGGSRLRTYLSIMFLFSCVTSRISVDIYAGSIYIQQSLGWNLYISVLVILVITALYIILGGLAAVILTDTFQTVVMVIGSVILSVLAFDEVGGMSALMDKYKQAIPGEIANFPNHTMYNETKETDEVLWPYNVSNWTTSCGLPRKDAWNLFRDPVSSDLPWPGLVVRAFVIATWYWCGDQVIIQRAIAAKDLGHARGATIFASYLKILPMFVITLPGMISRVLYTDDVACVTRESCMKVCGNPAGCSNIAYPKLVLGLAPIGLKGLMMAVMISSMMSSLTSIFNSAATVFSMDLWCRVRKSATERESLIVGKVFIVILVCTGVAWIPLVTGYQEGQLFIYITSINGYLTTPFCAVLLSAMFVPRVNEKGSFYGMAIGHLIGITRMVLDFCYPGPRCGEPDSRPGIVAAVHPMYFATGHLLLSGVVIFVISVCTDNPSEEMIDGLTVWTVNRTLFKRRDKHTSDAHTSEEILDLHEKDTLDNPNFQNSCQKGDHAVEGAQGRTDSVQEKLHVKHWVHCVLNINLGILLVIVASLFVIFN